jgi:hypothetical protein
VRDGVRAGDPEGHIALSGTQVTNPWNGCDWHRLDAVIDDFLSYSGGNQWDIHRSFAQARRADRLLDRLRTQRSGRDPRGVGGGAAGRAAPADVLEPVDHQRRHDVLALGPRPRGSFKALRLRRHRPAADGSERLDDWRRRPLLDAVVHAPDPGQHERGEAEARRDELHREPRRLGGPARRPRPVVPFVASPQVEAGALAGQRVLVLPYSTALSDRESRRSGASSRRAACSWWTPRAGLFDEHVAWRETGALDTLLAIAAPAPRDRVSKPRAGGAARPSAEGAALGLRAADLVGLEAFEPALRAKGGRALLQVGDADLAVTNRVGRGRTVYLNALLDRKDASREAWRAVVRAVLADAGVRPAVSVSDPSGRPVSRVRVARYRFGEHEVIALLDGQLDVKTSFGRDGVTVYEDARHGRVVRAEVDVALPRAARRHQRRTGEALGRDGPPAHDAHGRRGSRPRARPSRRAAASRGPPRASARRGAGLHRVRRLRCRRLLRFHVLGPGGAFLPEYARVSVADGPSASFTLPRRSTTARGVSSGAWATC